MEGANITRQKRRISIDTKNGEQFSSLNKRHRFQIADRWKG